MIRKSIVAVVVMAGVLIMGGLLWFPFMRGHGPFRGMMGGTALGPAGGLVAVSAEGTPPPPAADATPGPENTATQTVDGLRVSLALSPYPPAGFQTSKFEITLADANNQAVTDATVNLDLTMPAMPMPLNTVAVSHAGNGVYRGPGRFTMRGFLVGGGVNCALAGQNTPDGFYNVERMLKAIAQRGEVAT